MGMNVLYARIYVHHAGAWYPQRSEEVLDPLELELQRAVNCHVDAENWNSRRAASAALLTTEPSPRALQDF